MPLLNYDHFDTTTWPDVGPVKTMFSGVQGTFFPPAPKAFEDFTFDEDWAEFAAFSDDPSKEDFAEQEDWNEVAWGNDPVDPESPDLVGNLELYETFSSYGPTLPSYLGRGNFLNTTGALNPSWSKKAAQSSGTVVATGFALTAGGVVSISQANVIWTRASGAGPINGIAIEVWVGRPFGVPGATITATMQGVNNYFTAIQTVWSGIHLTSPIGISGSLIQSGVTSVRTPPMTSPYAGAWVGFHAINTGTNWFLSVADHDYDFDVGLSLGVAPAFIGMSRYDQIITPATQYSEAALFSSVTGAAGGIVCLRAA